MKQISLLVLAAAFPFLLLPTVNLRASTPQPPANKPLVLAHYMAWFRGKPFSAAWGQHWTMGKFNPEKILPDGRREIASHEYPLIGPYDSSDPDLIEYHVLLMKLAGIDGVIADWYGNESRNDYAEINKATLALHHEIERRGMKFAITFEDRIYTGIPEEEAITLGHDAFGYAECMFFSSPSYVRLQSRPVVLLFGPAFFTAAKQWDTVLAGAEKDRPKTYALHAGGPADAGTFAWPPMHLSRNGILTADQLRNHFAQFYSGDSIPAAVLGFHDIYQEAGTGASYGFLDPRDGATFRETLAAALQSEQPIVQLITWNDFGEGTAIEPTREFGTSPLDETHKAREGTPMDQAAVAAAVRIYGLRKTPRGIAARSALDHAVDLLHGGNTSAAVQILDDIAKGD